MLEPISERLSLEELIHGYTRGNAYQLRMEDDLGAIEVGKRADIVIVDRDIFELDRYDIKNTKVLETIRDGQTIYQRTEEAIQAERFFEEQMAAFFTPVGPSCC